MPQALEQSADQSADQGSPDQSEGGMEDVVELAKQVGQGLAKLAELMGSSDIVSEEERSQMSQILSSYTDLVEKKLSQDPGASGPQPADQGVVSAQAGPNGVPMGPQSRM